MHPSHFLPSAAPHCCSGRRSQLAIANVNTPPPIGARRSASLRAILLSRRRDNGLRRRPLHCALVVVGLAAAVPQLVRGVGAQTRELTASVRASGEPSLPVTMRFIQDKLQGLGTIRYRMFDQNSSSGSAIAIEYSYIRADPADCVITYHQAFVSNSQTSEADLSISLSAAQDIVVEPLEKYFAWQRSQSGSRATATITPAVTTLVVHSGDTFTNLVFVDPNLANRLAKAMTHAIELCSPESKEPF